MSQFYRYRMPPWLRKCLVITEQIILPLAAFQLLRTLFFPTTFDIILSGFLIFLFVAFTVKWI
ncbi:hypothetical protein [Bacillus solimangrovi]|uniref:Membrane protein YszA n=1 Tax=Bacillus solimangrovi TaxID=1305675 RepID=A0A1E5LBI1_9BACI|nr:hypothetical protein [Bacillus solimangrovi]OEH91442.1 hypothetical protein BFG57_04830 [Bacillus solimangrovi]